MEQYASPTHAGNGALILRIARYISERKTLFSFFFLNMVIRDIKRNNLIKKMFGFGLQIIQYWFQGGE